jgi:hypothetical protein
MEPFKIVLLSIGGVVSAACANISANETEITKPITRAEAKSKACPESLLDAGASPEDCLCIETELFRLGQVPGALTIHGRTPKAIFGDTEGVRKIAIGLLRHDAIEHCGLFDPDHTVAKNL